MSNMSRLFVWVLIASFGFPNTLSAESSSSASSASSQAKKITPNYQVKPNNQTLEQETKNNDIDLSNDTQLFSVNQSLEKPAEETKEDKEKQEEAKDVSIDDKKNIIKKFYSFVGKECLKVNGKQVEDAGMDGDVPYVVDPVTKKKLTGDDLNKVFQENFKEYNVDVLSKSMTEQEAIEHFEKLVKTGVINCHEGLALLALMFADLERDLEIAQANIDEKNKKDSKECVDCKNKTGFVKEDGVTVQSTLEEKIQDESTVTATSDDLYVYLNDKEVECKNVNPPQIRESKSFVGRVPGCLMEWGVNLAGFDIEKGFEGGFIGRMLSGKSSCVTELVTGFFKMLWSSVKAIFWDLPKMAWDWLTGKDAEDKTSEKAHGASQLSDEDKTQFLKEPLKWISEKTNQFLGYIGDTITSNFGCEGWKGVPHASECAKPWPGIPCAKCSTLLHTMCGVYGALGSEIITAILTGGAVQGIKYGGTAVANGVKLIAGASKAKLAKATSVFRVAAKEADSVASIAAKTGSKLPTKTGMKVTIGRAINKTSAGLGKVSQAAVWSGKKFLQGFGWLATVAGKSLSKVGGVLNAPFKYGQKWIVDPIYNSKSVFALPAKVVIAPAKGFHSHAKDYWTMMDKAFQWDFAAMRHIRTVRLAAKAEKVAAVTGATALGRLEHLNAVADDVYKSERLKYEVMLEEATKKGDKVNEAFAKKQIRLIDDGRAPITAVGEKEIVPLQKYKLDAETSRLKNKLNAAKTEKERNAVIAEINQLNKVVEEGVEKQRVFKALTSEVDADIALAQAARSQGLALGKHPSGAYYIKEHKEVFADLMEAAKAGNLQATWSRNKQLLPGSKIFGNEEKIILNYKLSGRYEISSSNPLIKPVRKITPETQKAMKEIVDEAKALGLKVTSDGNRTVIELAQGGVKEYNQAKAAFMARAENVGFDVNKEVGMFAHPPATARNPQGGVIDQMTAGGIEEIHIAATDAAGLRTARENAEFMKAKGAIVVENADGSITIRNLGKDCKI